MNILAIPVLLLAAAALELPAQTPAPPAPPPVPATPRPAKRPKVLVAPHPPGGSFLGIAIVEIDSERAAKLGLPQTQGVEVSSVFEGSAAAEAGLREGDVVLEFAGERVRGVEHFSRLVRETPVGRRVDLSIFRGGKQQTLTAEDGERKGPKVVTFSLCCNDEDCEVHIPKFKIPKFAFDFDIPRPLILTRSRSLGAELETVEDQIAAYFGVKSGALVRSVDDGSAASKAGLKAGDVIVSMAGKSISQSNEVGDAIRNAHGQDKVACEIMRNKSKLNLSLELLSEDAGRRPVRARPVRSPKGNRL
jgi:serine protease Do